MERARRYYAVTRRRGPDWDGSRPMREQARWQEHAAFMDRLADDGFIVLGGPLGEGEEILLVIRASRPDDIEARLAEEPWTAMGLLRLTRVERWEVLLGAHNAP